MKAEHRKQLQTNALADRVGKFVQTLKTKPQKRTLLYVILILAVGVGLIMFLNYRKRQTLEKSMLWVRLDNGFPAFINELAGMQKGKEGEYTKTNVGKAARFQFAYMHLWDNGIKALVARPPRADLQKNEMVQTGALVTLEKSIKRLYKDLHKECEEDPVWGAEALYNLAVIEETLAVKDFGDKGKTGYLAKARGLYQEVVDKYQQSVQAKYAANKVELLKDKSSSLEEVSDFYRKLAQDLRLEQPK